MCWQLPRLFSRVMYMVCLHPVPTQLALADPGLSSEDIKARRDIVAGKHTQLQGLREQHAGVDKARCAAAAALHRAEATLRDAHHARLQQRQQLLEQQAMQASALVVQAAVCYAVSACISNPCQAVRSSQPFCAVCAGCGPRVGGRPHASQMLESDGGISSRQQAYPQTARY